ncbi:Protein phosphatase 2C family protein [Klebsormidium nitens]|uniref:Protein phosphatase 2C family protein n=1 Tax=Klebsormidium nitens TaxID=105231 RepID=A0A1Y1HQS3_KLENI|nr:Protein phosphatase 2C family protein [Klebsormidium nitens]|eukprot:GAQ78178.1 Protein phosphatase 2C family protein [Klebsormidium nitens]
MAPSRGRCDMLPFAILWRTLFIWLALLICITAGSETGEELFCGTSLMQGFRDAMEDRALCIDVITIPLAKVCPPLSESDSDQEAGRQRLAEAGGAESGKLDVRAFAVFDGHGGAQASEFAARHIRPVLEAELVANLAQDKKLCSLFENDLSVEQLLSERTLSKGGAHTLESLSKAVERALLKLDTEFQTFAMSEGIDAGTTACVAVLVGNRWLQVANVGDSRATLCSTAPPSGCPSRCPAPTRRGTRKKRNCGLCAQDLTSNHRFDRQDEIDRVRASGGVVLAVNGVPRLMGVSMLSRAIGDLDLKPYGMIPDPELSEWIDISDSDVRFLVLASDGVYEDIPGGQCVCDLVASIEGGSDDSGGEVRRPAIPLRPSDSEKGGWVRTESETSLQADAAPDQEKHHSGTRANLKAPEPGVPVGQRPEVDGRALLPGAIAEKLRDVAFQKGSMDNIAVVVVDLHAISDAAKDKAGTKNESREQLADLGASADGATGKRGNDVSEPGADVSKRGNDDGKPDDVVSNEPNPVPTKRLDEEAVTEETAGRAIAQVDDSSLVEAGGFKVYISGQVVYGEGSDWCYQLVELVSGLRALPAPDTSIVAVPSNVRPPQEEPVHTEQGPFRTKAFAPSPSFPVYTGGVHAEHVHTEPVPTEPVPTESLPVCSALEAPVHTGEAPVHTAEDLHPIPLGLNSPDGDIALPQSPSPWATTLELYHRHLVATIDPGLGISSRIRASIPDGSQALDGLGTFLDIVASVPVEPGGWTESRSDWKRPPGESTGEEVGEEWTPAGVQREEGDHRYRYLLRNNFAKGSFGEIWRAVRVPDKSENHGRRCRYTDARSTSSDFDGEEGKNCHGDAGTLFILKRLLVEKGGEVRLSGLREKFFGEMLMNASATWQHEQTTAHAEPSANPGSGGTQAQGSGGDYSHLVRYIDSFEMHSGRELWLVFRDEGKSLRDWMYDSPAPSGDRPGLGVVTPSAWWRWLRTDVRGRQEMKSIMWQLLAALRTCHQHDVTHRDVKPDNLLLVTRPAHSASDPSAWQQASNLSLRLIDFGSAWSPAAHHLYGAHGPSRLQETPEYSPPEALFAQEPWLPRRPDKAAKYDMWSAGVLFLELLLGNPHVFQVSARTRALLERHLAGCRDATCKELAYVLRAFLELCIYPPAPMAALFPPSTETGRTAEDEKPRRARQVGSSARHAAASLSPARSASRIRLPFTTKRSVHRPTVLDGGQNAAYAAGVRHIHTALATSR